MKYTYEILDCEGSTAAQWIGEDVPPQVARIKNLNAQYPLTLRRVSGNDLKQAPVSPSENTVEEVIKTRDQLHAITYHAVRVDGDLYAEMWTIIDELQMYHNRGQEGLEQIALQIIKLQEEIGEVANAYIGVTGQNQRKGVYADSETLAKEFADVILTGMVGLLTTVSPVTAHNIFWSVLKRAQERINNGG